MSKFLNVTTKIQAFGDPTANANPQLRFVDWTRNFLNLPVDSPKSESYTLDPGESWATFNGTRSTSLDNTTQLSLDLSTLDPSRYRLTWTGGTNPVFRTDRNLTLSGVSVSFTMNANGTATLSVPGAGPNFSGVVVGDTVFVPDSTTGDSPSPFNNLNVGFWTVLAVNSATNLVLVRPAGTLFTALTETVTPSTNNQLMAFSAAGIQVGDKVQITGGFSQPTWLTYDIITVTSKWVEISSSVPLATQDNVTPTTSGIFFYKSAKAFIHIEVDQEASIRLNGSTDDSNGVSPIEAGNPDRVGWFQKRGSIWSLTIVNKSSQQLNVTVISAE